MEVASGSCVRLGTCTFVNTRFKQGNEVTGTSGFENLGVTDGRESLLVTVAYCHYIGKMKFHFTNIVIHLKDDSFFLLWPTLFESFIT